jgi:alkaline phosphatase D
VTWDDHEVDNDYANDRSENATPRERFLARRASAYQAYWEHMPLPLSARPVATGMTIYTRIDYGALARFHVLDGRQYRSHQVCAPPSRGGGSTVVGASCAERLDPALTLLGAAQESWLDQSLASSRARWNVIAQQTLMAQLTRRRADGASVHWTDGWDGYPAARRRLLDAIVTHRVANPVVIGGDVHAFYAADLRRDFDDLRMPVIASEICGTSITSQGPNFARLDRLQPDNPHLRFAESRMRGYVSMTLAPREADAALRVVETVKQPDASVRTLARFVIENGRPGPLLASS